MVRNGPNEQLLAPAEPISEFWQQDHCVIGYVGVIGVQDGVDYMVRALHKLHTELGRQDFVAVIVGYGPAVVQLKKLVHELGLDDKVHFTGRVEFREVPQYIAAFDICLTPDPSNSYNDSCTTIKTMEYMALGKPTVCFQTHENRVDSGRLRVVR